MTSDQLSLTIPKKPKPIDRLDIGGKSIEVWLVDLPKSFNEATDE